MPYYVQRYGKTWRIIHQSFGEKSRNVSKTSSEAKELGFTSEMTADDAKAFAKRLQAESKVERENTKAAKARVRLEKYATLRSAFLTDDDAAEFERTYIPEYKINRAHWHTMQKIIIGVALHPSDWFEKRKALYEQFRGLSPSYSKKLLRYLNLWGYFVCRKHSRPFMKVPSISGVWKNRLEEQRKHASTESRPLSPKLLEQHRKMLKEEHYQWLYISVWFGLRPREINNLRIVNRDLQYVSEHINHGYVLSVFQEKLFERGVQKDDCWKHLPCVFPEQRIAISYIEKGQFKQPTGKTLARVFGVGLSGYAGRNYFSGLLREAGYDLETRKHWMGHLSIATTEQYDRKTQKNQAFYRAPIKKAG